MKKIIILFCILLLSGCGEKKEPLKETTDTIKESKKSTVRLQIFKMFEEAEMKWTMGYEGNCMPVSDLKSNQGAQGVICIGADNTLYADDIEYAGYICNGQKSNLECVGDNDD